MTYIIHNVIILHGLISENVGDLFIFRKKFCISGFKQPGQWILHNVFSPNIYKHK